MEEDSFVFMFGFSAFHCGSAALILGLVKDAIGIML